jgi:hypothetical protein
MAEFLLGSGSGVGWLLAAIEVAGIGEVLRIMRRRRARLLPGGNLARKVRKVRALTLC